MKAVLFAAKSTADPKGSIPTQLADALALAEAEGYEVADQFTDEAHSAFHGDRGPGLAAALAECERLASEHGEAALIVQHSDRLARGDGKQAKHLVEYALWGFKHDVAIRSVQDDESFRDLIYSVVSGMRNHQDSARKSASVKDGKRRAAARGEPQFGIIPDGYKIVYTHDDDSGKVVGRTMQFDPERQPVYELTWAMALAGNGVLSIVYELEQRGYLTSPRKGTHRPRLFDANRVRQTLDNPVYSGMSVYRGEVVGRGSWPAYVSYDDFKRLKLERGLRGHVEKRKPGRQPLNYLLTGLARCGHCKGPMDTITSRNYRADGSRARRYTCRTHRERPTGCSAKPIDAELVDRVFIARMSSFLGDVKGWHDNLVVTHAAEQLRLATDVEHATSGLAGTQHTLEKMNQRYAKALGEDNDALAEAIEGALIKQRAEVEQAGHRLNAAQTALQAIPADQGHDDILDFFVALRDALTERTQAAEEDIKRLNAVIRDFFASVMLSAVPEGVLVQPHLSPAAVARITADWEHPPLTLIPEVYDPDAVLAERHGVPAESAVRDHPEGRATIPPLKPIEALRANPQADWHTTVDSWWGLPFVATPLTRTP